MNNDESYRNAYNSCIEEMISLINIKMTKNYGSHESILSVMLELKNEVLTKSFRGINFSEFQEK